MRATAAVTHRIRCGVVLVACALASANEAFAAELELRCAQPLELDTVGLPLALRLDPAARWVLLEERGTDLVLVGGEGPDALRYDLAPSGWAYQPGPGSAARIWRVEAAPSIVADHATLRLEALCGDDAPPAAGAALRALGAAALATARGERGDDAPEHREQARRVAIANLDVAIEAGAEPTARAYWSWLLPQAWQARAFIHGRLGAPDRSRADLAQAERAWTEAGDGFRALLARHRQAQQMRRQGDLDLAEQMLRAVLADPVSEQDPTLRGIAQNDLCLTVRGRQRLAEAVACYDAAIALHRRNHNRVELAISLANRADALAQLGLFERAAPDAEGAVELALGTGSARARLLALLARGNLARAAADMGRAVDDYLGARRAAEQLGDRLYAASLDHHLGIAYLLLGDSGRARGFLVAAATSFERSGYWNGAALARRNLAATEQAAADLPAAWQAIEQARAIVEGHDARDGANEVWLLRAELAFDRDDREALGRALAWLRLRGAGTDRAAYPIRQRFGLLQARSALATARYPRALQLARAVVRSADWAFDPWSAADARLIEARALQGLGREEPALELHLQIVRSSVQLALRQRYPLHRARHLKHARRALAEALRLSLRLRGSGSEAAMQRLQLLHEVQTAASAALWSADASPAARVAQAALNDQVRRYWGIVAADERQPSAAPALAQARAEQSIVALASPPPAPFDPAAWARLPPAAAVLVLFVGPDHSQLWRVDRAGVREWTGAGASTIRPLASRLDSALAATDAAGVRAAAQALRGALGVDRAVDTDTRRWFVLGDVALRQVPLLLLIDPGIAADGRTEEPFPVISAINALRAPSDGQRCCGARALHAFADPALDPARLDAATRTAMLSRLPGGRREARLIAADWAPARASLWLGAEFTRTRAIEALQDPGAVVHFATHGLLSRDGPALHALLVAADEPGRGLDVLSFHDLATAAIGADLVVLGACDAAAGTAIDGAGTFGLLHALLAGGAREAIAPLWPVGDRAQIALVRALYAYLAAGHPPANALALAQQQRAAAGDGDLRDWLGMLDAQRYLEP